METPHQQVYRSRSLLLHHHRIHHHLYHPCRHPYINDRHPPNPQSSRQPHSYDDSRLQRRLRRGHTQRLADSTPHSWIRNSRSPHPETPAQTDWQTDEQTIHVDPLPDDSSPHGHIYIIPNSTPR